MLNIFLISHFLGDYEQDTQEICVTARYVDELALFLKQQMILNLNQWKENYTNPQWQK